MLTTQKRKFACALMSGMTQTAAAIKAGYSEKSARSKASQLAREPEVLAFIRRKKKEKVGIDEIREFRRNAYDPAVTAQEEIPAEDLPPPDIKSAHEYEDPLEFLRSIMNNAGYEIADRKDAAKAMLPYVHQKKGDAGKKDAKNEAAKKAANKFAVPPPPKLVINNRGN